MASNIMPAKIRENLSKRLDVLFGRVLVSFPCPLTYSDRHVLGRCNMNANDAQRVEAVRHLGVLAETAMINVFVDKPQGGNNQYWVRLYGRDAPDPAPTLIGMTNLPMLPNREHITRRLGHTSATNFFKWLDEISILSEDIVLAMNTFSEIMDMVKTAGHLRRMVPELYCLATGLNQNPSFRASAVPYEWALYSRHSVEWLTTTIAKCQLLPESEAKWSERKNHTWLVINEA